LFVSRPCFGFEVLSRIDDHFVGSGGPGYFRLGVGANCGDHLGAAQLCCLHDQRAHTSRRSMDERRVAGTERIRGVRQVLRSHALEHRRRRRLEIDLGRQCHHPRRGRDCVLGVGAQEHRVGDAIPDFDPADGRRPHPRRPPPLPNR
jgi:hypothetical protein